MLLRRRLRSARKLRYGIVALVPCIALGAALVTRKTAHAEGATADKAELSERCAIRLSIALLGKSADREPARVGRSAGAVDGMSSRPSSPSATRASSTPS